MARIPTYQQQTMASSVQTGRGTHIGEALSALGNAGMIALERFNQVQDEKQKELIYTAASKARGEWASKLTEMYSQAPVGATGVHEQFVQDFDKYEAEQRNTVPEDQRALYDRLMTDTRSQLMMVSMDNTVSARTQQAKQNFETSMNDDMNFIMQNPAMFTSVVKQAESRVDQNSLIDGNTKSSLREQLYQKYSNATLQGLVNSGKFEEARRLVSSGELDKFMSADTKARSTDFINDAESVEINKIVIEQRRRKAELQAKDNSTLVGIYADPNSFSPKDLLDLRNKGELSDEGYITAVKELNRSTSLQVSNERNARALETIELKQVQESNYKGLAVDIESGKYDNIDNKLELLSKLRADKSFIGEAQYSKVLTALKSRGNTGGKSLEEEKQLQEVFSNPSKFTPEYIAGLNISASAKEKISNLSTKFSTRAKAMEAVQDKETQDTTFSLLTLSIAKGEFDNAEKRTELYNAIGSGDLKLAPSQITQVISSLNNRNAKDMFTNRENTVLTGIMANPEDYSYSDIQDLIKSRDLSLKAGEKAIALKKKMDSTLAKTAERSDFVDLLGRAFNGEYIGTEASSDLFKKITNGDYSLKPSEAGQIMRAVNNSKQVSPFVGDAIRKLNAQAKGVMFQQGPFGMIADEDSAKKMYNFTYIVNDTVSKAIAGGMKEKEVLDTYFDPKSSRYLGKQIDYIQNGGGYGATDPLQQSGKNAENTGAVNLGTGTISFEE